MRTRCQDGKFVIRTTDRGIYRSCRQRWDFASKVRQSLVPKGGQPVFDFGTSIHTGAQTYYDPITWPPDEAVRAASLIAFSLSETSFFRQLSEPSEDDRLAFKERYELGVGMLKHYFEYAPTVDNFLPKKVEIEFEVPVPTVADISLRYFPVTESINGQLHAFCTEHNVYHPVVYQGRIDLLVEDENGKYWIVDHKTAGQFGSTAYLDLDGQCGSYIWALRQLLGLPIAGVIYNRLLKSVPHPPAILKSGGLSRNKQQHTTYGLYLNTINQLGLRTTDYADFLQYLSEKPNPFFQRVQVNRNVREMKTLERRIVMEAIEMLNDPWIYPNPGLFNCNGCAYKSPCLATQEESDVEFILKENYTCANS